jgi:hypothetical protein
MIEGEPRELPRGVRRFVPFADELQRSIKVSIVHGHQIGPIAIDNLSAKQYQQYV